LDVHEIREIRAVRFQAGYGLRARLANDRQSFGEVPACPASVERDTESGVGRLACAAGLVESLADISFLIGVTVLRPEDPRQAALFGTWFRRANARQEETKKT
jgi:hypothetical protein